MNKQLIISNLKEIIRTSPNTYASYVSEITLKHVEESVDAYFSVREVEKVKPK